MKLLTTSVLIIVFLSIALAASLQSPNAPTRSTPVRVGEMAPDFALADQHGQNFVLSAARGTSPVVLVFYRGYW